MVFSSATFLFAFMPAFFMLYLIMPGRTAKNVWLLLASLIFYAWGEPAYVLLMIISIVANWMFGIVIGNKQRPKNRRKAVFAGSVLFNIAVIGLFKYEGFIAQAINGLAGFNIIPDLQLPLPIGISFYTLQALSYVADVYRDEVDPQRNLLYLGMYVACFPQLIAGPIVRYSTIQKQIVGRRESVERFASGMRLFIIGLAKKVLLANTVAILADKMVSLGGPSIGAIGAWAGLIAYAFQIYFDFSGYSDMAIGLGRMMGFEYLRNFNYPYISQSITEFWRRWHISLSSFFRDYVYIPLGGSRCSRTRNALNIGIVWAITGLWHGAAWNYVLWGLYYGALLIGEKFLWGNALGKLPALVGHIYTIAVFVFGWSFFWITDPGELIPYWQALTGQFGITGSSTAWELTAWEYWPVLLACTTAATPLCPYIKERFISWVEHHPRKSIIAEGVCNPKQLQAESLCKHDAVPATPGRAVAFHVCAIALDLLLLALLAVSCMQVLSGSFNPFIYFQF